MWKLKKEEYSELCNILGDHLDVKGNWIWQKESKNDLGRFHQFQGVPFNSSTHSILRIYFELRKIELFKNIDVFENQKLNDSTGEFINHDNLLFCLKEYSSSKLREFKEWVDFGLYDPSDLEELENRMNSLF